MSKESLNYRKPKYLTQLHSLKKRSSDFNLINALLDWFKQEEEKNEDIYELRHNFNKWHLRFQQENKEKSEENQKISGIDNYIDIMYALITNTSDFDYFLEQLDSSFYLEMLPVDISQEEYNNVLKYLSDGEKWYNFLISLDTILSSLQLQNSLQYFTEHEDRILNETCHLHESKIDQFHQSKLSQLISKISYLNIDIEYHVAAVDKPEIIYNDIKNISVDHVKLRHLCKILTSTFNSYTTTSISGNKLQVGKNFMKLSTIMFLDWENVNITQAYSLNTIFIDENVNCKDKQLILIAPFFVVKPLSMYCLSDKKVLCNNFIPDADLYFSMTDGVKSLNPKNLSQDCERLGPEGITIQPSCDAVWNKSKKFEVQNLIKEHGYAETPGGHGGFFFGFRNEYTSTFRQGYLTLVVDWYGHDTVLEREVGNIPKVSKFTKLYGNSLYNLTLDKTDYEAPAFLNKSGPGEDHYLSLQHALNDYKSYLLRNVGPDQNIQTKRLMKFYHELSTEDKIIRLSYALGFAEELVELKEIYCLQHRVVDFLSVYNTFVNNIQKKLTSIRTEQGQYGEQERTFLLNLKILAISEIILIQGKNENAYKSIDTKDSFKVKNNCIIFRHIMSLNSQRKASMLNEVKKVNQLIETDNRNKINKILLEMIHTLSEDLGANAVRLRSVLNKKILDFLRKITAMYKVILVPADFDDMADNSSESRFYDIVFSSNSEPLKIILHASNDHINNTMENRIKVLDVLILMLGKNNLLSNVTKFAENFRNDLTKYAKADELASNMIYGLMENLLLEYRRRLSEKETNESKNAAEIINKTLIVLRVSAIIPEWRLLGYDTGKTDNLTTIYSWYARKMDNLMVDAIGKIRKSVRKVLNKDNVSNESVLKVKFQVYSVLNQTLHTLQDILEGLGTINKFQQLTNVLIDLIDKSIDMQYEIEDLVAQDVLTKEIHLDYCNGASPLKRATDPRVPNLRNKVQSMLQYNLFTIYFSKLADVYNLDALLIRDNIRKYGFNILKKADELEINNFYTKMENFQRTEYKEFTFEAHFNRNDKIGPFYTWSNSTYGRDISNLLSGQRVFLKASLMEDVTFNVLKFKKIGIKFQSLDNNQAELDNILNSLAVRMNHLGASYYKCNKNCYMIRTKENLYNFSYNRNSGKPDEEYVLSPYSLWEIQLYDPTDLFEFSDLSQFKYKVDLDLEGFGRYLKSSFIEKCNIYRIPHYKEIAC